MNTSKITLGFAALMLTSASIFTSCKKEKSEDNDTSSAADNTEATQHYNDINTMADEALRGGTSAVYKSENPNSTLSTHATLIWNNLVNYAIDGNDTVTIDFGTTNVLCNDGRYRRGQVRFIYNGLYRTVGTVITATPNNYFVNDNQVAGSKTISNVAPPSGVQMRHHIVVNGTIYKANNGGTITWNSTRDRDWVSGDTTFMWNDDVYNISGSASGTNSSGNSFTSTITSPLVRKFDVNNPTCKKYFIQGTIEHTPSGKATRTIDFGNGTCDNTATVTINGHVYTITLH